MHPRQKPSHHSNLSLLALVGFPPRTLLHASFGRIRRSPIAATGGMVSIAPLRLFTGSCEEWKRPLPCQTQQAEQQVDDLEYGDGADDAVEICGEEIEEDFGPEEGVDGGEGLVGGGDEDEEAGPVYLDEFAHSAGRGGKTRWMRW